MYDFIHTELTLKLISNKVVSLLMDNQISGWSTYPVRIVGKSGNAIEGYSGLSIIGRCGKIFDDRAEIIEKRNENNDVYKVRKGLVFETSSWDGSDMFSPDDTIIAIISDRARQVLSNCTNVHFKNIKDSEYNYTGFGFALNKSKTKIYVVQVFGKK